MVDPVPTDYEQRLANRLRREAQATRPAFSEALHARVCAALERPRAAPRRRPVASRLPNAWLSAAIAVLLAVGAWLGVAWLRNSPSTGPGPDESVIALHEGQDATVDPDVITEPTGQVAEHLGLLVDETVTAGQWAYLDHDAALAVRLLIDQLPFDAESGEPL